MPSPSGAPAALAAAGRRRRRARRSRRAASRTDDRPRRRRRRADDAVAAHGRGTWRVAAESESRSERMSAWSPHAKPNRSKRGSRERVLPAPPGVDRVDVGGHPRRELGAPVEAVGRVRVDTWIERPVSAGGAVLRRRRAAPRRGDRIPARRPPAAAAVTSRTRHERRRAAPRVIGRRRSSLPANRGSLPASRRRMLWRWSARTPSAAIAANPTTGHEASKARHAKGSALAVTIDASDA